MLEKLDVHTKNNEHQTFTLLHTPKLILIDKNLNVKVKIMKLPDENLGKNLCRL